jgi:hypothetical protein
MLFVYALGPCLALATGVGFLVAAAVSSSAAAAYRAARPCQQPGADPSGCYELRAGVITSVHVSQTRTGEEDEVVLATQTGSLRTTLTPSSADAPHVRSGASAQVKLYRGAVTAVFVDGLGVPSLDNPAANQSQDLFLGIWLTGLPLVVGAFLVFVSRRRRRGAPAAGPSSRPAVQLTVVPGGGVGTMIAPHLPRATLWQFGLFVVIVLVVSARWLFSPTLAPRVLAADGALILVLALALWLYVRNTRLFVDGEGLGRVDRWGRLTRFPRGSIVRAVRYRVSNRSSANPYLSFLGPDGREVFKVPARFWDNAELEALCERAGVPVEGSYDDLVGVLAVNRRVPRSLKWGRTNVITPHVLVIVVAHVIIQDGPTSR